MNLAYRHFIAFAVNSLKHLEVPQWNPYIYCGAPFLPNTSATIFYPLNFPLLMALPQPLSINLCILLHAILLGVFTVHYARYRHLSNRAALLAGALACCGSVIPCRVFAGHFTIVCTAAWIPLLFYAQERMFNEGRTALARFACIAALMFLGGHLQYTYYAALMLGANLVFAACTTPRPNPSRWMATQIALHIAAGIMAFSFVAVEALPVLETLRHSARTGTKDAEWLRFFSMPPENLMMLVAPGIFGAAGDYAGRWFYWETCCYFGVGGLVFALTAIGAQCRRMGPNPLALLFLLTIALSLAGSIAHAQPLLRLVPGWTIFRGHAKLLGFGVVFGALLAGEGFDRIRANWRGRAASIATALFGIILVGSLLGIALCGSRFWLDFFSSASRASDHQGPAFKMSESNGRLFAANANIALGTAALWAAGCLAILLAARRIPARISLALVMCVCIADTLLFAWPLASSTFPPTKHYAPPELGRVLAESKGKGRGDAYSLVNEAMSYGCETIRGNDVNMERGFNTFIAAYMGRDWRHPWLYFEIDHESPLLDCANLEYLALDSRMDDQVSSSGMSIANRVDGYTVWKRSGALPRAYVVNSKVETTDNEDDIYRDLTTRGIDFHRKVLLCPSKVPQSFIGIVMLNPSSVAVPVEVRYFGLHRVDATAPRGGWLVLCDAWNPHWHATIDSIPVEVLRANGAFRAVRVKKGDQVTFTYSNPAFQIGAILSSVSLLALAAAIFLRGRSRRRVNAGVTSR